MIICSSERLYLRSFTRADAGFVRKQVNEPSWIEFIGDRNIKSVEDAEAYIETKIISQYAKYGFGMYAIELKEKVQPIGMCGLVQRDYLDCPDLGFALLESYCGRGYALEAASTFMDYAVETLGLRRILAITTSTNERSGKLLSRLGFCFSDHVTPPADEELDLYEFRV